MAEVVPHLEIVGPGRAGLALGILLLRLGAIGRLSFTGQRPAPPDHPAFHGPPPNARYRVAGSPRESFPDALLIAVPDARISAVAETLATEGLPATIPVLHLSGALGADALQVLAERGFSTGAMHPLAALSDDEAAAQLGGAAFVVEGAPAALELAERLVGVLGGRALRIDPGAKALYHAGAVLASNFVVALLDVAERWMESAGLPREASRPALTALAAGAVESVRRLGPEAALTGPISRGDMPTVARHLARLSPPDRELYSVLASSTLALARRRGLDLRVAAELALLLEPTE